MDSRQNLWDDLSNIIQIIEKIKPVLIVIDNLRMAFADIDTNSNKEITRLMFTLLALCEGTKTAVVITDHFRKHTAGLLSDSDLQTSSGVKTDLVGIDAFLSIARSYKIFTFLAIQNLAQLVKNYGKEQADVLFSLAGNIICGQAIGDTAKAVQEAIGKIVQTNQSISINSNDTSVSKNTNLDYAVPASRITRQSSGEFSDVLADNPDQPLKQKLFHCEIINDHEAIAKGVAAYVDIPQGNISEEAIEVNFIRIKNEITKLIIDEMERIQNDPELAYLLIDNKKTGNKSCLLPLTGFSIQLNDGLQVNFRIRFNYQNYAGSMQSL